MPWTSQIATFQATNRCHLLTQAVGLGKGLRAVGAENISDQRFVIPQPNPAGWVTEYHPNPRRASPLPIRRAVPSLRAPADEH